MKKQQKYLAALLAMLSAAAISCSALSLELPEENAASPVDTQTSAIGSLTEETVKPGLNVYTGSEEPYSFEVNAFSDLPSAYFTQWWGVSVTANPATANNTTAKVIKIPDNSQHFDALYADAERPNRITLQYLTEVGEGKFQSLRYNDVWPTTWSDNRKWSTFKLDNFILNGSLRIYPAQADVGALYIDNISVVPYYKVTYMDTNGTDELASEYVLPADGVLVPSSEQQATAPIGRQQLGWSRQSGATEPDEGIPLANEDVVLYPVFSAVKPGLNVYTGSEEPYSFEVNAFSDLPSAYFSQWWNVSVTDNPATANNASAKAVKIPDNSQHFDALYDDAERPNRITLQYLTEVGEGKFQSLRYNDVWPTTWSDNRKWSTFKLDNFVLNGSLRIYPAQADVGALYVDNVSVVPYYKVTYMDTNGTDVLASEYVLPDDGVFTVSETLTATVPEGMYQLGWSRQSGADSAEQSMTLAHEDVVLYPVFAACAAPEMLDKYSIRFGTNKGLRFAATVDLDLRASRATEEYGFLVTRKTLLGENASDTLKVWIDDSGVEVWEDSTKTVGLTKNEVVFVAGRAWISDGSVDLVYDNAGGTKLGEDSIQNGKAIGITAVLTGITEDRYEEVFVVRPYAKIFGSYYYGEAHENSYYAVAQLLRGSASYDGLTEEQKAEIDNVIASVEG